MLGCGPGGILGHVNLVLVPRHVCDLMGNIMVVTTSLWSPSPQEAALCPSGQLFYVQELENKTNKQKNKQKSPEIVPHTSQNG